MVTPKAASGPGDGLMRLGGDEHSIDYGGHLLQGEYTHIMTIKVPF